MATITVEKPRVEKPTVEKLDFKAPAEKPRGAAKLAPALVQPAPLLGTWIACDKQTRGLVKVVIAQSGRGLTVHAYGNCTPTPCDWGAVAALPYAANVSSAPAVAFSANYKFAFKQTVIVGRLDHGTLIVETFDHFTDGSGRSDYASEGYFYKT